MSGWVEAFLEMMAVERAAARNTLTAHQKDLADASGFHPCTAQSRELPPPRRPERKMK